MSGILQTVFQNLRSFITVPGAPTIGTATVSGTTASITFTAPASNGGSAITSYTATSSPGGLTGSAASSPVSVSGLTIGTAYTFTVTATNAIGTGPASAASNSVTPSFPAWLLSYYKTATDTRPSGIAVDSSSNVIVAAMNVIAKFTNAGALSTQTFTSGITYDSGYKNSFSVDSSGNRYAGVSRKNNGFAVIKYDSSNAIQWGQRERASSSVGNISVAMGTGYDSSGNVYVSGQVSRLVCGDNFTYSTLVKYNSSGTRQWIQSYNDQTSQQSSNNALTIDTTGTPIIGIGPLSGCYNLNTIVKVNSSTGAITWQRTLTRASQNSSGVISIASDSSNNIYFTATYNSAVGGDTGVVAKYNSSGTIQWQRKIKVTLSFGNYNQPSAVTVDSSANVYVALVSYSPTGGLYTTLIKYNTSGTLQWQRQIEQTAYASVTTDTYNMTFDNSESSVVLGISCNTGASPSNPSLQTSLILKYPSDGSKTGTYTVNGLPIIISTGVATDAAGDATDSAGVVSTGNVAFAASVALSETTSAASNSTALTNL